MNKIGILYIVTGRYIVFWKNFYKSFEKYFLPNCEIHFFVFTDAKKLFGENKNARIHKFYKCAEEWPFPTLFRFNTFLSIEKELEKMDYLFFFNANSLAVKEISEDLILPSDDSGESLVVALHPAFYNKNNNEFTYDRNPNCNAYIPYGEGDVYVAGGVNGGYSKAFLKMCHDLDNRIKDDYRKNIIALWHDESHLNKYILETGHYRLLSPSFVFPTQDLDKLKFEPIILMREKKKYFNVSKLRLKTEMDVSKTYFFLKIKGYFIDRLFLKSIK